MDTVYRIIGYLSVPVVVIGVAAAIWSTLRERPLRVRTLLLASGISVAYLLVHDLLRGNEVWRPLGWLTAGIGTVLGARWAGRSRLRSVAGRVLAKGEAWYLAVWGLAVVVVQVSALGALGESTVLGVYAIYLTTGLAPGVNVSLWVRLTGLRQMAGAGAFFCPHCGSPAATGTCASCGWRVLAPSVPATG